MFRLRKDPRRTHRGAPDHDPGDARFRLPPRHVGRAKKIAVADHRDGNRRGHLRDHVPIGRAGITLRPGATVDREGGHA